MNKKKTLNRQLIEKTMKAVTAKKTKSASGKKRTAPEFNDDEKHFVQKAEQYCEASEQCATSVRDKMVQWKVDKELSDRIIEHLEMKNLINEARYVTYFCNSKLHQQHWGRTKIAYHLRLKQIPSEAIAAGLAAIDDDEYRQILSHMVRLKHEEFAHLDNPARIDTKVIQSLSLRGFEPQEIRKELDDQKAAEGK